MNKKSNQLSGLIPIIRQNGLKLISLKELYNKLGYYEQNWSVWYKRYVINNEFVVENYHYFVVKKPHLMRGRPTIDFLVTLDFACMLCVIGSPKFDWKLSKIRLEILRNLLQK